MGDLIWVWWACPSCPVDEDKPGKCGVCGRDLVRKTKKRKG